MIPTENLRRQHRQLLELADKLSNLIKDPHVLAQNPAQARALLSSMSGVLTVHLAMEDGVVYPKLARHWNTSVRQLSQKYVDEMGGLKAVYAAFIEKWRSPETIQRDPVAFAQETTSVLQALAHRIDRENNELYPLVDGNEHKGRAVA